MAAVHNVARYLPDFIESIEDQSHPLSDVTVVAVDDGSTDDSLEVLRAWQARRPELVTVITKENGGQGSARNAGLEVVDCDWVTFPDPDDAIAPDYLAQVSAAIDRDWQIVMVATNRLIWQEHSGELLNRHPLRSMFAHGDEVKNLDGFPEYFHGSCPAAFLQMDLIRKHDLRFDERIRPNFEDGNYCQRYLLRTGAPVVAFLKSAIYKYRKRMDQSSTMQSAPLMPSRFIDVPRHGFLELLEEATESRGHPPEWLQNMIIYELSYYVSPEDEAWIATACHGDVADEFVQILRDIRSYLDEDVIRSFNTRRLRAHWRQVLLYSFDPQPWHSPYVVMHRYDKVKRQVLISYRFTGPEPDFEPLLRGQPVTPVATKIRDYRYWDRTVLRERLVWLPARGTIRIRIDGRYVEMRTDWRDFTPTYIRPRLLRARLGVDAPRISRRERLRTAPARARRNATQAAAKSWPARHQFADAWVIMDRVGDAGDNGQRLFEYIVANRPDINAWFVLHPDSPDWDHLRRKNGRIVAYGSWRWKLLLQNCRNLISSHADVGIVRPPNIIDILGRPQWNFIFLQHGVIKDDISGWLNNKSVDLFITSTPAEHESIVGDGSSYMFTAKEVQMTGLARFDRLRRIAASVGADQQRTILVAPTWRNWLNTPLSPGEHKRHVVPNFIDTDYAKNWLGLLTSRRLAELCRTEQLRIGFLPHPNLQSTLDELTFPSHVDALRYADNDVQQLFAQAAVLVTDYSSVAFNAAYIDRPVVYFQFDRPIVAAGGHLGKQGYFEYDRDGFGPVSDTLDQAVENIVAAVRSGRQTQSPYAERIAATFPERDGNCCERIVAAVEALSAP